MANRCAFKDGGRRCGRNGFGNPALCRAHAIQATVDGKQIEFSEDSPLFEILNMADRAFSRSNNDFLKQVGNLFGEMLSGAAHQTRVPEPEPQKAPEPPQPLEDARVVLGFAPDEQLTASSVKARKKQLARIFHPDQPTGSLHAMKRVNEAADKLLKDL